MPKTSHFALNLFVQISIVLVFEFSRFYHQIKLNQVETTQNAAKHTKSNQNKTNIKTVLLLDNQYNSNFAEKDLFVNIYNT